MARLIDRVIKKPLSEMLLFDSLDAGARVRILVEGDEIKLVAGSS
jgi:ATP-dependent Clp protease ATP-binding subunit ClpA